MKYSFDTYGLYQRSAFEDNVMRYKVVMKDAVDGEILEKAVNTGTGRYPYFLVRLKTDEDGGFCLELNSSPVKVIPTQDKLPGLCSESVNGHLLFIDYCGRDVYFNISHALAGGKGTIPWVFTCLYNYVTEKYGVIPDAPAIIKPDSEMLPGEDDEINLGLCKNALPYPAKKLEKTRILTDDGSNGCSNPPEQSSEYYEFEFAQDDIVNIIVGSDNSVASLFSILMFKTMARVFPDDPSEAYISKIIHNPRASLGKPNAHQNILSHVMVSYKNEISDWGLDRLGTITRGAVLMQTSSMFSIYETKKFIEFCENIDRIQGYEAKLQYGMENNLLSGRGAAQGTYVISYSGHNDIGELEKYIDKFFLLTAGNQLLEMTAYGKKIFLGYMQTAKTNKYIEVFKKILDENSIAYAVNGPFMKNLSYHDLSAVK